MIRPVAVCCVLTVVLAGTAHASINGFKSPRVKTSQVMSPPPPAGWRGFKTDGGGLELSFSPEGPGQSALSMSCKQGDMRIEIRAPTPPGETSSTAIRLVSGGIVRVFFAKQAFAQTDSENMIVARAPTNDEMLKMFRKTGRLVAGRALLFARTPGEKSAIEDFFAGCA
jgi:hypothetical protein